jgi:AbiV family abortive infection protein
MEQGPEEPILEFVARNLQAISDLLDKIGDRKPYRDRLSPKQIAEGMNAASRNAKRLLEDAEILLKAKRYPTAVSVAILAIEEAGKCPILRSIATAKSGERLKESWKAYRSHRAKNVMWLMPLYVLSGVRTLDGFKPLFDENSKHKERLDDLKQGGFYTDCLGKGSWVNPEDLIDDVIAEFIVKTARSLTKEHPFTEREIELWIKHVGPSQDANPENLRRFWEAMMEEGFAYADIDNIGGFLGLEPKAE